MQYKEKNNHEMKCNDKEDSHVSLPNDHTPTVASGNVVSSTPPIHLHHSELSSTACGIGDLDHKKESHTNGSDDEQINSALGTDDEHDAELEEDQAALDHRQELTGDALPSMVQIDSLENCIYQCAPGENNVPWYILLDDNFEVLASPDLFPYGQGAYHTEDRTASLPIHKYFQQRLLNVDTCFARNIQYIFCAQYFTDIKQIETLSWGRTLGGEKITAGVLCNPLALKQLVRNEQAYKFLKNVRGSPAYWQNEFYDVLAMLQALGTPTFLLTLSAAYLHWPEMIQAVASQCGHMLYRDDVLRMSLQERSEYFQQNPVTGVWVFQHRLEIFFSQFLLSGKQLLGHIGILMKKFAPLLIDILQLYCQRCVIKMLTQ